MFVILGISMFSLKILPFDENFFLFNDVYDTTAVNSEVNKHLSHCCLYKHELGFCHHRS